MNQKRISTLATIIQHYFRSPGHSNQRSKTSKKNTNWKRRSKTATADHMILYIENPKDATRKQLELINEFVRVAGYTVNAQKSLTFLYIHFFFLFPFVSMYVYAAFCDFVCIAMLLPFVLGFCLSVFWGVLNSF